MALAAGRQQPLRPWLSLCDRRVLSLGAGLGAGQSAFSRPSSRVGVRFVSLAWLALPASNYNFVLNFCFSLFLFK